jgi:hypothetical protein
MSGVGESIALNLVADIIIKTVEIGYHVVTHSALYAKEAKEFITTIELQIGIWQAASRKLQDERIQKLIRDADLLRFAKGSEQLHRSMQKFVARKCTNKEERKKILETYSADELIEKLDEQRILEKLSDTEKDQSWGFWNGLRQEIGYVVLKQSRDKQLVTEIVFWGTQLDRFSAAVFPSMFSTMGNIEQVEQVADIFASKVLTDLNSRGAVLLAHSVDSTVEKVGEME